jgi:hypothetical protein
MMNRRKSIGLLLSSIAASTLVDQRVYAETLLLKDDAEISNKAYLMAHFMENDQKLYYAYSFNARDWTALNGRKPVFDSGVDLRDPYIGFANGAYHLVHTKGWDHPVIHHYISSDLLSWDGGEIKVIHPDRKRAWAPEWIFDEQQKLFYLFWASEHNGHNCIYYTTTKDWKDIRPEGASVYYDIDMDVIDLTITKVGKVFHAFHKCGSLADNFGISHMVSPTLNPKDKNFGFGKQIKGTDVSMDLVKPIEGPQIIKLIDQNKWYLYADPFHNDFIAWETTDFVNYKRIPVSVPRGAKHCSIISIHKGTLDSLLTKYPV